MNNDMPPVFKLDWEKVIRANKLSIFFWPLAGFLIICIAWVLLLAKLSKEKISAEQLVYIESARVAANQASQSKRSLEMIDQILLLSRIHWKVQDNRADLANFAGLLSPPGVHMDVSIFDSNGKILLTNAVFNWSRERTNVSESPFFSSQRQSEVDTMFIGMPMQGVHNTNPFVRFSRKLEDDNGDFQGVVVVSLETQYLIANYDRNILGDLGFISAVGDDGDFRAFQDGDGFRSVSKKAPSLQNILIESQGILLSSSSFLDKPDKYYLAWHSVGRFPLTVLVGVNQGESLELLTERERASIQTAAGATIAMLIFVLVALSFSLRFAGQRYRLYLAQSAYREATEAGSEGFFIAQPLRDMADVVHDYLIVDCNERGAVFISLKRDELIGRRLSELTQLLPVDFVRRLLDSALMYGTAEDELTISSGPRPEVRHAQAKVVESSGVLAITLLDVTIQKTNIDNLEKANNEDPLTGLQNRAWITKWLPDATKQADENNAKLAVLFIDLDGFKSVNDTLGHSAGDELLQIVGRRLRVAVRPGDHVARLGGDEFVVVLETLSDELEAEQVAIRVIDAFAAPFKLAAGSVTVGSSVGISIFPKDAKTGAELLQLADIAMYEVKTSGKNQYRFFDQAFYSVMQSRLKRKRELACAVIEGQFVMHYQSLVDATTGEVLSLEALIRWNHPSDGLVMPDDFIPLAEETGLIIGIGELVINIVCAQISIWRKSGAAVVPVSINLSNRQFAEMDIRNLLFSAASRYEIESSLIEIELTESVLNTHSAQAGENFDALRLLGIKFLVDDFGTGYSSLSVLRERNFNFLKVDKSFTSRLGFDEQSEILFEAIITMGHALGMKVVAEGVETVEQLNILRKLRCDELQGFYISIPAEAAHVHFEMWPNPGSSGMVSSYPRQVREMPKMTGPF